jgi:hypothetical protein
MSLDQFTNLYLSYLNDFLTVGAFAEYHGLTLDDASFIVDIGSQISHRELEKV